MAASEITAILGDVLGLGERAQQLTPETPLLGALPEFDSMAVVSVLTALEEHYGIVFDVDDIDAAVFESVGTLTVFVEQQR